MSQTDMVSLEVLVEEMSAAAALRILLPRIIPGVPFTLSVFNGKQNLLRRLPHLFGDFSRYWSVANMRMVVLVDRDHDDCVRLKSELDKLARDAGLPRHAVLSRIVIEELEAWFLGDVRALRAAYPRLPHDIDKQAKYRDPERVPGGTWEALEHLFNRYGYHRRGLAKVEAATDIAAHMDVESNRSTSFQVFRDGLRRLVSEGSYAQED